MSAASPADSAAFWDSRARRFAARFPGAARNDPFLARVRRATGRTTTVLDVGAGPGRFALALAPRVRAVTAVDPSKAMLSHVRRQARSLGIANIHTVHGRWQDVDVPPADVGICSYVLPIVDDADRFLAKLDASCHERVFLYLGAMSIDAVFDPLWRHFHGKPRRPGPTYLDAMELLKELGVAPEVEVVEVASRVRFKSMAAAVADYSENLMLPDDADVRGELREILRSWMLEQDGQLRAPVRSVPAAVISWSTGGRG